jgi:hypothetical protein
MARLLGPDDGARLSAGRVTFGIRVDPAQQEPRWELAYARTDTPEGWGQVAEGQFARPTQRPSRQGPVFVDVRQPAPTGARLVVTSADGVEVEDTIDFTVVEVRRFGESPEPTLRIPRRSAPLGSNERVNLGGRPPIPPRMGCAPATPASYSKGGNPTSSLTGACSPVSRIRRQEGGRAWRRYLPA